MQRTHIPSRVNHAVLDDPPTITHENVVALLSYPSSIVIPCSAVHLWSLAPETRYSQNSGLCKILYKKDVDVPGTRTVGTYTNLVVNPVSVSSTSTKVTQDNQCVS